MSRTTIEDEIDPATIRVVGDKVLVREVEREKTYGGIYLGQSKGTECTIAEVIKVGTEIPNTVHAKGYPIEFKTGDIVLFMAYSGDQVHNRIGKYRFVKAQEIWAKVKMKDLQSYEIAELEPQLGNVLVEPVSDGVTKGGIVLNQGHDHAEFLRKAFVRKVGPGVWNPETYGRYPMGLEINQEILMMRYAGADVVVNGVACRIIERGDIKALIEREVAK